MLEVFRDLWEAVRWVAFVRYRREAKGIFFVTIPLFLAGILVPAFVANQTIRPTVITVSLASLLYLYLWFNAAFSGFRALRGLYGYPVKSLLPETDEEQQRNSRFRVVNSLVISFAFTVYGFAITYVFLSNMRPRSFNVGELDVFSGIYFSVTTIATVGYGDIVPVATLARLLVMCEIFAGMLYAILAFSIVASFLREKR